MIKILSTNCLGPAAIYNIPKEKKKQTKTKQDFCEYKFDLTKLKSVKNLKSKMKISFSLAVFASLALLPTADGHGYMFEPSTRNYYAHSDGLVFGSAAGVPEKEYCQHCLNSNAGVCGISQSGTDYDAWLDSQGNPMPWITQRTYEPGQVIEVHSHLASVRHYTQLILSYYFQIVIFHLILLHFTIFEQTEPCRPYGAQGLSRRKGFNRGVFCSARVSFRRRYCIPFTSRSVKHTRSLFLHVNVPLADTNN